MKSYCTLEFQCIWLIPGLLNTRIRSHVPQLSVSQSLFLVVLCFFWFSFFSCCMLVNLVSGFFLCRDSHGTKINGHQNLTRRITLEPRETVRTLNTIRTKTTTSQDDEWSKRTTRTTRKRELTTASKIAKRSTENTRTGEPKRS